MTVERTWESSPDEVTGAVTVIDRVKSEEGWDYRLYYKIGAVVTPKVHFREKTALAFCHALNYFNHGWGKVPSENQATQEE